MMDKVKEFFQANRTLVKGAGFILSVAVAVLWLRSDPPVKVGPKVTSSSRVVILLHGYGASKNDLAPLAEEMLAMAPGVSFVLPSAPHSVGSGSAWIPSFTEDTQEKADLRVIEYRKEARGIVVDIIDDLISAGVSPSSIYVGGFSQGAAIALDVIVNEPAAVNIGGLIFMSGGGYQMDFTQLKSHAPFRALVSHAQSDPVVSSAMSKELVQTLKDGGHKVTFIEFDKGHTIAPPVRTALGAFLAEL